MGTAVINAVDASTETVSRGQRWDWRAAFLVSLGAILLVAVTNLVWPRNYTWLAWDFHSYFSSINQVVWGCGCVLLMCFWELGRRSIEHRKDVADLLSIALVLGVAISFWACRTPYPSLSGDHMADIGFRLRGFITDLIHQFLPGDRTYDGAALWAERLFGIAYLMIAVAWVMMAIHEAWSALALLAFLLFVPQILNAYGHYDGYTSILPTAALWWMMLWRLDRSLASGR